MNGNLISNSPQFGKIRTSGTPDNPLFCLADVCKALGLGNPRQVKVRLSDDVISNDPITDNLGRSQTATFVNEDGLYDVILDSRKPEARAFRKWITSEVLPAIRRTGGYIPVSEADDEKVILAKAVGIYERTVKALQERVAVSEARTLQLEEKASELRKEARKAANRARRVEEKTEALRLEAAAAITQSKCDAPLVKYAKDVLSSSDSLTLTQVAKQLGLRSVYALRDWLLARKVLFRQSGELLPCAKYADKGFFVFRTYLFYHKNGDKGTSLHIAVTEPGRKFLNELFNEDRKEGRV